jgi:hypothetical protein
MATWGGKRPGSGRKRVSEEDHKRRGTFKPSRHGVKHTPKPRSYQVRQAGVRTPNDLALANTHGGLEPLDRPASKPTRRGLRA